MNLDPKPGGWQPAPYPGLFIAVGKLIRELGKMGDLPQPVVDALNEIQQIVKPELGPMP
jgi:hypothetical protein